MSRHYRAIAEYYDAEYAHQEMLRHDVPFFLEQMPRKKQRVLELAVGTARAAIPIAQAGHRVVGIDYAPEMLAIARRKRDAVGLVDRELSLIEADVLGLNLGEQFDIVCIFFNTFLAFISLAEQDQLLEVVKRHLRPGGRLWIDIFNPDFSILAQPTQTEMDPHSFHVPALDRTVFATTEIRRDRVVPQLQHITFRYTWFDARGTERRQHLKFDLTYMLPRELLLLLDRHGFTIEQQWGNHDGSALKPDSPRIVSLCRIR